MSSGFILRNQLQQDILAALRINLKIRCNISGSFNITKQPPVECLNKTVHEKQSVWGGGGGGSMTMLVVQLYITGTSLIS